MNAQYGKIIPVAREASRAYLTDSHLIKPRVKIIEGIQLPTTALRFDTQMDILGLSQFEPFIEKGWQDQTDCLDPMVAIESIYLQVGKNVVKFDTMGKPFFNFVPISHGDYKHMTLTVRSSEFTIGKGTLDINNKPLSGSLVGFCTHNFRARFEFTFNGQVKTDLGRLVVYAVKPKLVDITRDHAGLWMKTELAGSNPVVRVLNNASLVGFDIFAHRANSKRDRQ